MRVIVCGGREFRDRSFTYCMLDALHARLPISLVIHGAAAGADALAADWATSRGIAQHPFPAAWGSYLGPRAGNARNRRMLREGHPDLVVALPGRSGTRDMVLAAGEAGVRVWNLARKHKDHLSISA